MFGEDVFQDLAERHPKVLVALLKAGILEVADLTFAAEIAGNEISDSALIRPVLLKLLEHPSAVVREGTLYGLANHLDESSRAIVGELAKNDPSPGVRTTAKDLLED
jgi:HEAT repeat protein